MQRSRWFKKQPIQTHQLLIIIVNLNIAIFALT